MARKRFTEDEMKHLRASKYVLDVSPTIVHFSAQFKKEFWAAFISGQKPFDIVKELGINPEILGETRISGLKTMIRNEVKSGNGFRDLETYQFYQGATNAYMSPEGKIRLLEQQLAYKDQEIAFLKKLCL